MIKLVFSSHLVHEKKGNRALMNKIAFFFVLDLYGQNELVRV